MRALPCLLLSAALPLLTQVPDPARVRPEELEVLPLDQLTRRGLEHHQAGRLPQAMLDWMELARRRPEGGLGQYNLACAHGLLGDAEQAAGFLEAAWKHGFTNLDLAARDTDFDRVREAPAFKAALARLRAAARKAVEEQGEMLRLPARSLHLLRVLRPRAFEAARPYPLVLALHGAGASSQGFLPFGRALAERGFLVCLLEGQYPAGGADPGAVHFLNRPGGVRAPVEESLRLAEDYVLAAVDAVRARYAVPPGKVFLTGFSQGAMLTYSVGLRHADRFRGFVPIGGTVVGDLPPAPGKGGAWLVCHSPTDRAVDDAEHRKAMDALSRLSVRAEVERYEGGHVIPAALIVKIADWMKRRSE